MDYYMSNFHPYEIQEMTEGDVLHIMSYKFDTHYHYSVHETPSNAVYSLVNPDEHDRILTDPAYRFEKL